MNISKYTEKAQEAVLGSQQIAERSSHAAVEPEHLFVMLIEQREGIVPEGRIASQSRPSSSSVRQAAC